MKISPPFHPPYNGYPHSDSAIPRDHSDETIPPANRKSFEPEASSTKREEIDIPSDNSSNGEYAREG